MKCGTGAHKQMTTLSETKCTKEILMTLKLRCSVFVAGVIVFSANLRQELESKLKILMQVKMEMKFCGKMLKTNV